MGGPVKKLAKASLRPLGAIGDAFGFGDDPKMPPPPPGPPTVDDAAVSQSASDAARRRRGRAASILTSPTGVGSSPTGTKTLLGA